MPEKPDNELKLAKNRKESIMFVLLLTEMDFSKRWISCILALQHKEEKSMNKNRAHYSPQQKVSIIKQHLLEKVPVSDLCDKCPGSVWIGLLMVKNKTKSARYQLLSSKVIWSVPHCQEKAI